MRDTQPNRRASKWFFALTATGLVLTVSLLAGVIVHLNRPLPIDTAATSVDLPEGVAENGSGFLRQALLGAVDGDDQRKVRSESSKPSVPSVLDLSDGRKAPPERSDTEESSATAKAAGARDPATVRSVAESAVAGRMGGEKQVSQAAPAASEREPGTPAAELNQDPEVSEIAKAGVLGFPPGPAAVQFAVDELGILDEDLSRGTSQIAASTTSARVGESVIATGYGLDSCDFFAWSGAAPYRLPVLSAAPDRCVLQMSSPPLLNSDDQGAVDRVVVFWPQPRDNDSPAGRPARVNAPEAWWGWPTQVHTGHAGDTFRIFGTNLIADSNRPRVYLEDQAAHATALEIIASDRYSISSALPAHLPKGDYRLWVHNGTGGALGWSDPLPVRVADGPNQVPAHEVLYDTYRRADRSTKDVMRLAIDDLVGRGGGTLRLPAERLEFAHPIILPDSPTIHLLGAGRVAFDPERPPAGPVLDGTLMVDIRANRGRELVRTAAPGARIEDLTIFEPEPLAGACLQLDGPRQVVRNVGIVNVAQGAESGIYVDTPGSLGIEISDCDFQVRRFGVWVRGGDGVAIRNSSFVGHYSQGAGLDADGVRIHASSKVIVEGNTFRSADRENGKILGRMTVSHINGTRYHFISQNTVRDTGTHPSVSGVDPNGSEQILFHHAQDREEEGLTEVEAAEIGRVLLSRDLKSLDVLSNSGWTVLLLNGDGAGQYRTVIAVENEWLKLDRPWRVVPGRGDRVVIQRTFTHHHVIDNDIEGGVPSQGHKAVGVYLYGRCIDNIVARNSLSRLAVGVAISSKHRRPSAWNRFTDNSINDMVGSPGGTSPVNAFYADTAREGASEMPEISSWVHLGHEFKRNDCNGSPYAVFLGWRLYGRSGDRAYTPGLNRGLGFTLIEKNSFNNIGKPVFVTAPTVWPIIRNNIFEADLYPKSGTVFSEPSRVPMRTVVPDRLGFD